MPKRKPPQGILNFSEALEIRHVGQVKERLPGAHSEKILRRESQKNNCYSIVNELSLPQGLSCAGINDSVFL